MRRIETPAALRPARRSGAVSAAHRRSSLPLRVLAGAVLAGLLAGCTAGPDFRPPAAPGVTGYLATPPADGAAAATPRLAVGARVDAQWWRALGSPKLDALIAQALTASPTLAEARATLRQARETHAARAGSTRYPRADADLGAQHQRLNPNALGQSAATREFDLYNAGIGVHYQLDLAGGNRRALEALAARAEYRRYQLEGAQLALAANLVSAAVSQARLTAQIEASQAIARAQHEQLTLAHARVRLGEAAPDEALALQTALEQTRADLAQQQLQQQQNEHRLALLAGRAAGARDLPRFTLADFTLPAALPLVLPSELVRRRPDIQAAEALLRAANAEYGVAVARRYPRIDLSASLGTQALTAGALFGGGSAVGSLLAQLTQPLLDPGLPAQQRAALAAFDAAAAHYQGVVLDALRDVADVLRALDGDAQILAARAAAERTAQASLVITDHRYTLGAASYLHLLTAQQQVQRTRIALIQAQAQRLIDTATLYQAMGGGEADGEADGAVAAQMPQRAAF